jgi:hypothetical protein
VGPRAVLDAVVKRKIPRPRRESNPRTPIGQLVAKLVPWSMKKLGRQNCSVFKVIKKDAHYLVTKSMFTDVLETRRMGMNS